MKAGDKVWVRVTFEGTEPDGMERFYHQPCGDDLAPDSPALPAVARWLAEHGDALRYGQHTPGDWLDVVEAAFDDQVDGVALVDVVMPALRALLAALTEETA
jgi:hypothetical protein